MTPPPTPDMVLAAIIAGRAFERAMRELGEQLVDSLVELSKLLRAGNRAHWRRGRRAYLRSYRNSQVRKSRRHGARRGVYVPKEVSR